MDYREARLAYVGEVISTITYKPTATLHWSGSNLDVKDVYLDSYSMQPEEYTWCAGYPPESIFETDNLEHVKRLVFDWVFEAFALTELHEVAEFLQMDGVRIHDPHGKWKGDKSVSPVKVGLEFPSGYERALEYIP